MRVKFYFQLLGRLIVHKRYSERNTEIFIWQWSQRCTSTHEARVVKSERKFFIVYLM
jgi:hypothetical protein